MRIDLFRPFMSPDARKSVYDVLTPDRETGGLYIGQGEKVEEFERALRTVLSARQDVLTMNSCTSALDLSLHLCGLDGAETRLPGIVVSTPMTCTATNSPIVTRGAGIVWADVDWRTGLIDPQSVEQCIQEVVDTHGNPPNAIMAVDWGGKLANYERLRKVAGRYGIPIVQDAAHAFGATVEHGIPFMDSESHGDYVCYSFQAIKHLTTVDGGALICPNDAQTERARLLRWYGLDRRSNQDFRCRQSIEEIGYKYHMNDVAAAIGLANLPHVEWILNHHRTNADYYTAVLHGLRGVILTDDPDYVDRDSSWWLYTLLVSDRESFTAFMDARGIATSPVHARNDVHPAFRTAQVLDRPLPGLEFFAAHEVAVPVGWWLSAQDRARICEAVIDWSREHGREFAPPIFAGGSVGVS